MPRRVAVSSLTASTIDILNVIRQNASQEYQDAVPEVTREVDIPKVGEVLYGYPAFANQFLSALINRIASVKIKSATFNNPYTDLKKGFLEFGETVEEVFVNIAKARIFSYDKAEQRELKRSMPDVRTALHAMNYQVQYPVTVTETDLRKAFLSMDGVQDLIARIVDTVYRAAEYDEFLLFKYLIIKSVAHGKMYPISIGDGSDMHDAAIAFRGYSNELPFMHSKYNNANVLTTTPKGDQVIFMDAHYNAQYDVSVLASAFNMDKAEFMGKLHLIDDFTTFDNERFDQIRAESDQLEEVTAQELALMNDVKAILVDKEYFQVYDNVQKFTEKFVASGDYWNYFYRIQKTISTSPFSNALVFVTGTLTPPSSLTAKITDKSVGENATAFSLVIDDSTVGVEPTEVQFIQTEGATEAGIAIHRYGAVLFPGSTGTTTLQVSLNGNTYTATAAITPAAVVGAEFTLALDD